MHSIHCHLFESELPDFSVEILKKVGLIIYLKDSRDLRPREVQKQIDKRGEKKAHRKGLIS